MSVPGGQGPAPRPDGAALPRLLSGIPPQGALSIEEHLAVHGPLPAAGGRGRDRAAVLIEEIAQARLLGRGGAAFPTARKMRAVAGARGRPIVVANGAEGEPASLKDRTLLEALPHLVLDGAALAAEAVGAPEAIVSVCESSPAAVDGVRTAIEEREGHAAREAPRLMLAEVPGHYVAGQESALVNYLDGGPALPTFTPPMPFEEGLRRRPTLVSNVETLAHVALIARHGAAWFRQLGTPAQAGTALVTISGPVASPGVYEIAPGSPLMALVDAAGGATARVRAALVGGYSGAWIGADRLRGVALSDEHLADHDAALGAGVVVLLSESACPVAEVARLADWLARQSARQCGPCEHGLAALARTLAEVADGSAPADSGARLSQLTALVRGRGACGHPDGAVAMIVSAARAFREDFSDHARHGLCESCRRAPELPLPVRPVSAETLRGRGARR
jgi:NADH:ubiquinone oxidoreductase subunit F (NADH-binding)